MLTGIHGFRHGVRVLPPNAPMKIKPEMFTLPQMFKKAGYDTAVIGKWHLGIGDGKVPVDWNGAVKPGTSKALVSQIDFIASLVGVELKDDQGIDSRNMISAFLGKDEKGLPYMVEEAGILALRQGPWKYIQGRSKKGKKGKKATQSAGQLYNLDSDVGEQNNIINEQPERAKLMKEQLEKIKQTKEGIRSL